LPPGRSSVAATSVDVPPTIAGLVGLAPDPSWSGRDLFREPESAAFAFECSPFEAATATVVDGRWKLNVSIAPPDDPGFEPTGLFDLVADPEELRDLAGDEPERVEALLDRWRDDLAATLALRGAAEDVELTHEELGGLRALGYAGD
jgi:arylsulfatase A-like enzyme